MSALFRLLLSMYKIDASTKLWLMHIFFSHIYFCRWKRASARWSSCGNRRRTPRNAFPLRRRLWRPYWPRRAPTRRTSPMPSKTLTFGTTLFMLPTGFLSLITCRAVLNVVVSSSCFSLFSHRFFHLQSARIFFFLNVFTRIRRGGPPCCPARPLSVCSVQKGDVSHGAKDQRCWSAGWGG